MFIAGFAAAVAAVAGYVRRRNRRSGASTIDVSDSRTAIVQANRQAVQDLRQDQAWGGLHRS